MKYLNEATAFAAGILIAVLALNTPLGLEDSFSGSRTASTNIVAVSDTGEGAMGQVEVSISPGNGEVLLNADPFIETDTQESAKTALEVAEEVTGKTLDEKDVKYRFRIDGEFVGGPSAGAAMTLATIAAIEDRKVPEDIAVTGTIRPDGKIGRIGGVLEKAEAAGRNDMERFFVPYGQEKLTYYTEEIQRNTFYPGLFTEEVEYVPHTLSVDNYTEETYNMSTEEVTSIEELYKEVYE